MAYPASRSPLPAALERADDLATRVRADAVALRDLSAAGPIRRGAVIQLMRLLTEAVTQWQAVGQMAGIADYARQVKGDATLDVVAEFTAMVATATDLRNWIVTNFPKSADGAWLVQSFDAGGVATQLEFTTAQMAQLRTRITALAATIA